MNKNLTNLLIVIFSLSLFINCTEEDKDTFEITITNPYNYDIEIKSSLIESLTLAANTNEVTKGNAGEGSLYATKAGDCENCSLILGDQGS